MDLDWRVVGLTGIFWALIAIGVWRIQIGDAAWQLWQKIVITIVMLPITYLMVNWQLNR